MPANHARPFALTETPVVSIEAQVAMGGTRLRSRSDPHGHPGVAQTERGQGLRQLGLLRLRLLGLPHADAAHPGAGLNP